MIRIKNGILYQNFEPVKKKTKLWFKAMRIHIKRTRELKIGKKKILDVSVKFSTQFQCNCGQTIIVDVNTKLGLTHIAQCKCEFCNTVFQIVINDEIMSFKKIK